MRRSAAQTQPQLRCKLEKLLGGKLPKLFFVWYLDEVFMLRQCAARPYGTGRYSSPGSSSSEKFRRNSSTVPGALLSMSFTRIS